MGFLFETKGNSIRIDVYSKQFQSDWISKRHKKKAKKFAASLSTHNSQYEFGVYHNAFTDFIAGNMSASEAIESRQKKRTE